MTCAWLALTTGLAAGALLLVFVLLLSFAIVEVARTVKKTERKKEI